MATRTEFTVTLAAAEALAERSPTVRQLIRHMAQGVNYKPPIRTRLPRTLEPGESALSWIDEAGVRHDLPLNPETGITPMRDAQQLRTAPQFHARQSIPGLYWSASTGEHHWYESQLERRAMRYLDFAENIAALLPQPLQLTFDDGATHIPDILVTSLDGTRLLVDVTPDRRLEERRSQHRRTADAAAALGWRYMVYSGFPGAVDDNIGWLSGFRRHRHAPSPELRSEILERARSGPTLRELLTSFEHRVSPHVFHLAWRRDLHMELQSPFSLSTRISTTLRTDLA